MERGNEVRGCYLWGKNWIKGGVATRLALGEPGKEREAAGKGGKVTKRADTATPTAKNGMNGQ